MSANLFHIVGVWRLTSEKSEELIEFLPDGTYRIYYEVPFRMIELGMWIIKDEYLVLLISQIETRSKILKLDKYELLLCHKNEKANYVYDSFTKVGE